jgi:hypothetical protein
LPRSTFSWAGAAAVTLSAPKSTAVRTDFITGSSPGQFPVLEMAG